MTERVTLYAPGALPGIPGEHAAGTYDVDYETRTITPAYSTQPLEEPQPEEPNKTDAPAAKSSKKS